MLGEGPLIDGMRGGGNPGPRGGGAPGWLPGGAPGCVGRLWSPAGCIGGPGGPPPRGEPVLSPNGG